LAWSAGPANDDQGERNAEIAPSNATGRYNAARVIRAHESRRAPRVWRRLNVARTPRAASWYRVSCPAFGRCPGAATAARGNSADEQTRSAYVSREQLWRTGICCLDPCHDAITPATQRPNREQAITSSCPAGPSPSLLRRSVLGDGHDDNGTTLIVAIGARWHERFRRSPYRPREAREWPEAAPAG
jgi:hypothetical protein